MSVDTHVEYPFIGGERVRSAGHALFDAVNPATEEVLARVVASDETLVDQAVSAAAEAQRAWAALAPSRRAELLWRWSDLVAAESRQLAETDTRNMGKALRDGLADGPGVAKFIRYWAGKADKIWGDQVPATPGHLSYTVRVPVGVYGIIIPWNGPTHGFASRVAPALACGNGVVVKPSEYSPLTAGRLAELTVAAGMPLGLVNVLPGDGTTGAAVAAHPGIGALSFTGSVPTGRAIARAAADSFKRLVLEMGGKSPNIVFADADLDAALRGSLWGVFYNAGQVCVAGTRLLVERSIAGEFTDRLIRAAGRVRVGDPMDVANHVGPLVSGKQYSRVGDYLKIAADEGAEVACGGGRPDGALSAGYYVSPTVLCGVRPTMRIAQEEIFGPVLSVLAFDDEDEAVALANGVEYGLSATIWTRDAGRMLRVADRLESGTIWGNTMRLNDPALPFGGFKSSGLGNAYAEGAVEGATRVKRVSIRFDPAARAPGWDDIALD
jgi:acyl-CoA reductase-like NAD-dependent aldehyde dehydrogenase